MTIHKFLMIKMSHSPPRNTFVAESQTTLNPEAITL